MLKVFLVEDEFIVRNGIKNSINWEKEGFSFVGEASDGELAYPLIKDLHPDILITDIRMPFMDGIELSEQVHELYPEIRIIILSGYGEFTYAQKAIKIGVEEYLLKPISSAQLLESVKKVAGVIVKEREEQQLLKQYADGAKENRQRDWSKFMMKLMTQDVSVMQVLQQQKEFSVDLNAGAYGVMLFKLRKKGDEIGYSEQAVIAMDAVKSYLEQESDLYFMENGIEGLILLLTGQDKLRVSNRMEEAAHCLDRIVRSKENLEYFGSMGTVVTRLNELKNSYYYAKKRYILRFMRDWNRFEKQEKDATGSILENSSCMDPSYLVTMGHRRELVEKFLKVGTIEEVEGFLSSYLENLGESNIQSLIFRQYVAMDFYMCVIGYEEQMSLDDSKLTRKKMDINQIARQIDTVDKLKTYLTQLLKNNIIRREEKVGRRYSDLIDDARRYIDQHYAEEEISLNQVARVVNMSPSYFSLVFGREAGQTFVEYLTALRMDKAKELLMCSSLRTSEIGYEVGYKDPHYFSYIFKKTQKCAPKEYRARRKPKVQN